ncbi:MAG: efflux RND transporter permease subunit [Alphaproteobacteria bacterium]|nr:efflux RND transporter permease subunit [Alphaproteobacteria bacterium]
MISAFVRRPIATTLLAVGVALSGAGAMTLLPVAPLPNIDIPTVSVQASMAGANPETMSSSVATPLERHLRAIASVTEMTSSSRVGSTSVVLQFDISRNIDGALRDVQAAIQAAMSDLPSSLRNPPQARKFNPASQPILILALTSSTLAPAQIFDYSANILQQRLSQIEGVGDATPQGATQPAIRVELNPLAVFKYGINLNTIKSAISSANSGANSPKGAIEQNGQRIQVYSNDNASEAKDFRNLIVAYRNNSPVHLSDVAEVYDGQENVKNMGVANGKPAVLVPITQQPGSNVIEVVHRIMAVLPELQKSLPNAIDPILVVQDPTVSIRNSVRDVEVTLLLSTFLVVLVVFFFLRNLPATSVPAVSVPLALLGTFSLMYAFGYSLNNFSLMALIISTGFVVDNAIVVLENVTRHLEEGRPRMEAALVGTSEVAFTVFAMSVSLVAVFIPILFFPGIIGKIFHEFAMVLTIAIFVSMIVSLTVTPMMCAYISFADAEKESGMMRMARRTFDASLDFYRRTLNWSLDNPRTVMATLFITIALNVYLYTIVPGGGFPQTDEGRLNGNIMGDQTASFDSMKPKFKKFMDIIRKDPAVQTVAGQLQNSRGNLYITLKPPAERGHVSSDDVRARLLPQFSTIAGARAFINSVSSTGVRVGGRQGTANYQYTLQADSTADLKEWVPKIEEALQNVPEIDSVNPDVQPGGLEMELKIDRVTASRMGLATNLISGTLQSLFSQGPVSTIYKDKNQYRVIMEVNPSFWKSPDSLRDVYVSTSGNISGSQAAAGSVVVAPPAGAAAGAGGAAADAAAAAAEAIRNQQQNAITTTGRAGGSTSAAVSTRVEKMVPLSAVVKMEPGTAPLEVEHQGVFVATTFSYNAAPGVTVSQATDAINRTMAAIHVPISVHGAFAGTAQLLNNTAAQLPMLVLEAVIIIYLILGILYESYIHPLTIISTLPSAGVGALLALMIFHIELSLIAFIGVMLLIGVVKKNAIIMIDFAVQLQRNENLTPREAIYRACLLRFRPIMMTTMGAILGALPLAIGVGEGYELRQPLGISIVGGLVVSQALTLYTTPVIYLYLDRFGDWCARQWQRFHPTAEVPAAVPAE